MDLKEFLENVPLYSENRFKIDTSWTPPRIVLPELSLFCNSRKCNGVRNHNPGHSIEEIINEAGTKQFVYTCNNCKAKLKYYSIKFRKEGDFVFLQKYGELPFFGTRVPKKVIDLFGQGDDREKFIKGRKCEDQGFGIGAYSYYRRVVENQKNRLIDRIIQVCKVSGIEETKINSIKEAKKEKKFSKSVEKIESLLPKALFIKTHNPLTLLHDELSKGIHGRSDADCLKQAKHIRVILTEFIKKVEVVLEEDSELKESLTEIFKEEDN